MYIIQYCSTHYKRHATEFLSNPPEVPSYSVSRDSSNTPLPAFTLSYTTLEFLGWHPIIYKQWLNLKLWIYVFINVTWLNQIKSIINKDDFYLLLQMVGLVWRIWIFQITSFRPRQELKYSQHQDSSLKSLFCKILFKRSLAYHFIELNLLSPFKAFYYICCFAEQHVNFLHMFYCKLVFEGIFFTVISTHLEVVLHIMTC